MVLYHNRVCTNGVVPQQSVYKWCYVTTESTNGVLSQQRVYKWCCVTTECLEMVLCCKSVSTYGAVLQQSVYKWIERFKNGCTNVKHEEGAGLAEGNENMPSNTTL
jgi:hypothetical protein